jgi:predicted GNAT family acetyltransferase
VKDDAVSPQPHSTEPTWAFSDYGEWLDEGTAAVLDDMGRRVPTPPSAPLSFVSVPPADYIFTVVHDEDEQAYKAVFGDEQIGYLSYRLVGGRVVLWSAAVLPKYRDHGVAAELIAKALDDIRASGKKVTVICPIVRTVIDHHPQYEDLVDKEHPGVRMKRPA